VGRNWYTRIMAGMGCRDHNPLLEAQKRRTVTNRDPRLVPPSPRLYVREGAGVREVAAQAGSVAEARKLAGKALIGVEVAFVVGLGLPNRDGFELDRGLILDRTEEIDRAERSPQTG
jgi:hypothetical protein